MQSLSSTGRKRLPLHIHVSALFALLMISSGTALGLFHYHQASQIIFSSSERLFDSIRRDVQQDLQQIYHPTQQLLELLALAPSVQAGELSSRLQLLPALSQALHSNPQLTSLYVGQGDGEFFMVRALRNAASRERFQAPEQSTLQVWSIERNNQQIDARHLFFDAQLKLIAERRLTNELYDPRLRDWYRDSLIDSNQITTRPYRFFSSAELGTTLARRVGSAVIAADITLSDLSQTLARNQVSPSTELVLIDTQGRAVAYHDAQRLVELDSHGDPQRIPAKDLSPSIAALLALPSSATDQILSLDQRRWAVSRSHLHEGGPEGLDLALLIPEDELLADAYRMRWQGALITLAVLLFSLPIGWIGSRIIARPLAALRTEAESIRRFDFSGSAAPDSLVMEIDEVASAMARMRLNLGRFMVLNKSLCAHTQLGALQEFILTQTAQFTNADAAILYARNQSNGQFEAQALLLEDEFKNAHAFNLKPRTPENTPNWLTEQGQSAQQHAIGFEAAQGLEALMQALQAPRLHLLSCPLHHQDHTVAVLVLLQRDEGMACKPTLFYQERIALIEAISTVAGACLYNLQLLAQHPQQAKPAI